MSIKKGKKQVYKVECKHKFGNTVGNTWNNVLYGNCYLCNKTVKVSPLKPKKSIKKTYKKDEEIEAPKTYKYLWMCDNCRKMDYVHIPLGTTIKDFIEKGFICKFCGC